MQKRTMFRAALAAIFAPFLFSGTAQAIPAFARKYHTSCTTCHTAWPVLTPFGEAFRRNGFRFPGNDKDAINQDMIKLGAPAYKKVFPNAVWPDEIPDSIPIALGFIGKAVYDPQANTAGTANAVDNQPYFTLNHLFASAHIWAGGTFNNSLSFFGEVTFDTSGSFQLERGYLIFNDLLSEAVGPYVFNLLVGRNFPTMSSFDGHSSYLVDSYIPEVNLPGMVGGDNAATLGMDELDTLELNGTAAGRFSYSLGINSGQNGPSVTTNNGSADFYGHVGVKLGGMRLDGVGGSTSSLPWEDNSVTIDLFGYHAESYYTNDASVVMLDTALMYGAALRGQLGSAKLDLGAMNTVHNHPDSSGDQVSMATGWGEFSYVVWPWFIPAIRGEYDMIDSGKDPLFATANPSLLRVLPGINFVIRPNVVLMLVGEVDKADGVPPGGWSGAGAGGIAPQPAKTATEFERVMGKLKYAF